MQILLVDNNSKHIGELQELLDRHEVITRRYTELPGSGSFDLIVLSGGTGYSVANHHQRYAEEIRLIQEANVPVLGICLGLQLIAFTFGYRLERLEQRRAGEHRIELNDGSEATVCEAHYWSVPRITGGPLEELAWSEDGVEVIRHGTRPIAGVQFHPEMQRAGEDGWRIFDGLFDELVGETV